MFSSTWSRRAIVLGLLWLGGCGGGDSPPAASPEAAGDASRIREQLIADLSIARVDREVARIDFGTPQARSHLVSGWGREERDREKAFAWGLGDSSRLRFFSSASVPLELVFECRSFDFPGSGGQTLELELNGETLGTLNVADTFEVFRVEAPADVVRAGENHLRLVYGRSDRPRDVLSGAEDERPLAVLWYFLELRGLRAAPEPESSSGDTTLDLPLGTRLSFYYDLRPGDELVIGEIEAKGGFGGPGEPVLHVHVEAADGGFLTDRRIQAASAPRPLRIPLGLEAPGLVRLSLAASRPAPESRWLGFLHGGREELSLLLPMVMGLEDVVAEPDSPAEEPVAPPESATRRPNLLVYLIDTLRADHLGVYGYERPTSPRIDAFADDAFVFLEARAQSSWTRTTVASVLTGLLPQTHGVNRRDDALPESVTTLAELLGAAGYRTLGFITNGNVSETFGMSQGFDHYQYLRESRESRVFHQQSDRVNRQVFRWLDTRPEDDERPFFLYLHTTDPHAPYTPLEPFASRLAADVDPELGRLELVHGVSAGRTPAFPGLDEAWIDLYDGEIAYNDHHFGLLLDRLRAEGLYDDTMIVVLSDHGEEFFEHGGWEHGKTLYEEQLRIPLLIKLPGERGRGSKISGPVDQVDILPTIVEALGLPSVVVDGRSLLPRIAGAVDLETWARPSFAYLRLGEGNQKESVAARGFKWIRELEPLPQGSEGELYDLRTDPGELERLPESRRVEGGYLQQTLARLTRDLRLRARGLDPAKAEVDDELRQRLEALGYVD